MFMSSRNLSAWLFGLVLSASFPALAAAQAQCDGDFASFLKGVEQEAIANGVSPQAAAGALKGASIDRKVLSRDRAQGVFKQTFLDFSSRVVSQARLTIGERKMKEYADTFARAEAEFGVPAPVITAFWALETDFGAVQGDFNTRNALATLSHDCRRPELFRPQLLAFLKLYELDDVETTTTGAWAGEIGQVQMLPRDILTYGTDGDGDGRVRLKESAPDVIMTAAKFIQSLGFRRGEPWLQEVKIPQNLPFEKTGLGGTLTAGDWFQMGVQPRNGDTKFSNLPAALVLPQGRKGPAFLAYPNFNVYLEWNKSFIYTTSAAYFATRLAGADRYDSGNPEPGLNDNQMKELQTILQARGHDVGEIDGILGSGTRAALQKEQQRLGVPADGWATPAILRALR
ncbi:lytic murein transglycosylase [Rhizobium sp. L1K21]|uniref:lytic murein transglycosylase n=1 Tax=Rhizobium sp. L1K21 TaxID=2954933 RepID=UPI0020931FBE|nr:lytic murein transglycosylase [Rhizobium sp. L1K21]MCO6185620.1 lytic murein transglycosylase [Rhizobium sp. L1K21]